MTDASLLTYLNVGMRNDETKIVEGILMEELAPPLEAEDHQAKHHNHSDEDPY